LKLGLVAVALAATPLLAGCGSGTVHVQVPALGPALQARCSLLKNHLPQTLASLKPRVISPQTPFVHAWGSPAVILTCGVGVPAGYSATSSETTVVNGVQWFEQPGSSSVIWTALMPTAHAATTNVRLEIPVHYEGQGAFLADLATPLKAGLT
jgi:hypothetical protein